jgi:hypothetical protein
MALRTLNGRAVSAWQCLVPLVVLTIIFTVGRSFLAVHDLGPPRTAEKLWTFEFGLVLAWWVSVDRRVRDFSVPFEFDAFVFFAWPFILPYYLYRTRGRRGLFLVTGIYGLFLMPYLTAQILRIALD